MSRLSSLAKTSLRRRAMSDWKESANKRKDKRHTKDSDEHKTTTQSNKRNTKKWCKGKVGVEHKLECRNYNEVKNTDRPYLDSWRVLMCSVCGKEMGLWF